MATHPSGELNNCAPAIVQGYEWLAFNLGDGHVPSQYQQAINCYQTAGKFAFPWERCYTLDDVERFLDKARGWPAAILNLEEDFKPENFKYCPPAFEVCKLIDASGFQGEVAISTVCWLYNNIEWHLYGERYYAIMPQIFPQENDLSKQFDACMEHAVKMGATYVYPTYGTHWDGDPAWYDLTIPHSLYPGNVVAARQEWHRW